MKKFLDILDRIEVAVASLVLAVLIGVTFVGVPMRYIFSRPFTWEEEFQLAGMVCHIPGSTCSVPHEEAMWRLKFCGRTSQKDT